MLDLITTEELLDALHVSRKTLYNHVVTGRLPPPLRLGRRRYWREAELNRVLQPTPCSADLTSLKRGGAR